MILKDLGKEEKKVEEIEEDLTNARVNTEQSELAQSVELNGQSDESKQTPSPE